LITMSTRSLIKAWEPNWEPSRSRTAPDGDQQHSGGALMAARRATAVTR
jgi:hypothetical protein